MKHHELPVATQCEDHNKEHGTKYTPAEFRSMEACNHDCRLMSFEAHFKSHYLYTKSYPEDKAGKRAFLLMYMVSTSRDCDLSKEMTEEELNEIAALYAECKRLNLDKMIETTRSEEYRAFKSDMQQKFYSSEEGKKAARDRGDKLSEWYATPEGKETRRKQRQKMIDTKKSPEGREKQKIVAQKVSNFYLNTEKGKEVCRAAAKKQSDTKNNFEWIRMHRKPCVITTPSSREILVYSLTRFCDTVFPTKNKNISKWANPGASAERRLSQGYIFRGFSCKKISREEAFILEETLPIFGYTIFLEDIKEEIT